MAKRRPLSVGRGLSRAAPASPELSPDDLALFEREVAADRPLAHDEPERVRVHPLSESRGVPAVARGAKVGPGATPMPRRLKVWQRLAQDLDLEKLRTLTSHVTLDEVPKAAAGIVAGKVRGRVVVDIR